MEDRGGPHCRGISGNLKEVEGEFIWSWTFQLTGGSQIDRSWSWSILLIEEDFISDDKLINSINEVEIKQLELEHDAREQERNRECQLRMRKLELREQEIDTNFILSILAGLKHPGRLKHYSRYF